MGDWEQKSLVNVLTQGRELAKQLQIHINVPSSSYETREFLVQKILASYEKALSMVHGSNSSAGDPNPTNIAGVSNIHKSESPPSLNGSPRSDQDSDRDQDFRDSSSRKRLLYQFFHNINILYVMNLHHLQLAIYVVLIKL